MPSSTFFKKSQAKLSLVIDIGSDTVGGALVEFGGHEKPKILYSVREQIAFQKNLKPERFFELMLKTLESAAVHLERYGLEHLNSEGKKRYKATDAVCVLSAPWHVSKSKIVKVTKTETVLVTPKLVNLILESEIAEIGKSLDNSKDSTEKTLNELAPIERKITEIKLNGYRTAAPFEKRTKEIELSLFLSFAPKKLLDRIKSIIGKHINVEAIEFHSFLLSSFAVLRELLGEKQSFLILHVGGELTEITTVENGAMGESASFPLGRNFLLRSMSRALNDTPSHVSSGLLNLHLNPGKKTGTTSPVIDAVLKQARSDWLSLFYDTLSGFSGESHLPTLIVMVAEQQYSDIFKNFIKTADIGRFFSSGTQFEIKSADYDYLKQFSEWTEKTPFDQILGIETVFHDAVLKSHILL